VGKHLRENPISHNKKWVRNMKVKLSILLAFIFLIFSSCQKKEFSNPFDPTSPNYEPPSVKFISAPAENETISSSTVTFTWEGNSDINLFRYTLVGYKGNDSIIYQYWTNWSKSKSVTFDYLDDLTYVFKLQTKYEDRPEIAEIKRSFKVDGIKGPTLKFFKLKNDVLTGNEFNIEVWLEDVQGFKSGSFKVKFDNSALRFVTLQKGRFPQDNRLDQVVVPDFGVQKVIDEANNKGEVEIATGVMLSSSSIPTDPPYLNGSGDIVVLRFRTLKTGQYSLDFGDVNILDYNGNQITLQQTKKAIVNVK
jgi:hypothetical protein